MMKIAILDDIPAQAAQIGRLASSYIRAPHQITVLGDITAFKTMLKNDTAVDIVLMDIDLGPQAENGIALAKLAHDARPKCQIIFISEYTRYVSAVYETEHLFFVTKSDMSYWLPKALDKAQQRLLSAASARLTITYDRKTHIVSIDDILYLERQLRTTTLHTMESSFLTSDGLDILLRQLPSPPFFQCHRSFLVNFAHVLTHQSDGFQMRNQKLVPISRSFAPTIRAHFHQYITSMI